MQTFVGTFDQEIHVLPWAERLSVPEYTPYKSDKWELVNNKMPPMLRGYYTDVHVPDHPINPTLKKNGDVDMLSHGFDRW